MEEIEYVESIKCDVKWLGFDWEGEVLFIFDYFLQLYQFVVDFIWKGLAYVDDFFVEEIVEQKGDIGVLGKESFYWNCSVEENLEFFEGMKDGKFFDGFKVLCVKIDMGYDNLLFCDLVFYCIKWEDYYCIGSDWNIYFMYDFVYG